MLRDKLVVGFMCDQWKKKKDNSTNLYIPYFVDKS